MSDFREQLDPEIRSTMIDLAAWLGPVESELALRVLRDGMSVELASAFLTEKYDRGIGYREAQNRIHVVLRRLADPIFEFTVERSSKWSRVRQSVADAMIRRGRSIAEAASEIGLSRAEVREQYRTIRHLYAVHSAENARRAREYRNEIKRQDPELVAELERQTEQAAKDQMGAA